MAMIGNFSKSSNSTKDKNMECPNCHAASNKQRILPEGKRQCTVCATVWIMTESGSTIVKEGQAFLAEIAPQGVKLI